MMGCLLAMFAGVFPRLALLFVWIARPKMVDAAFDTWILPILGIIFLPFATLMYVILWRAGGLSDSDWIWIVLAGLLDILHWGGGWSQRRQAPGYPTQV
jgi:uncharacterized membrane protein